MKKVDFTRDPRQFDSSSFYIGLSIVLYSFGHPIGGTILLIMGLLIWGMYKIFGKYLKDLEKQEKQNDINKDNNNTNTNKN